MQPPEIRELAEKLEATGFGFGPFRNRERNLKHLLLGMPGSGPRRWEWERAFPQWYEPGTFTLAERASRPPFLAVDDRAGFETWVLDEVAADLERLVPWLERVSSWTLPPPGELKAIPGKVLDCLVHRFGDGRSLAEDTYQQEYTDVFRRFNCIYTTGWPRLPFTEYDGINSGLLPVALRVAERCEALDLPTLVRVSAAAGLVGVNHKKDASATSVLHRAGIVPTSPDSPPEEAAEKVLSALVERARRGWAIDGEATFLGQVLGRREGCLMALFTDDYFETVVDLKLAERLLKTEPNLRIVVVPRAVRVGNDASAADILHLLRRDTFRLLHLQASQGRFSVELSGPLSGTLCGHRLSARVVRLILRADVLFVKGARSYECLQGVLKPAYYAFAVCRSMSESVTGVDADTGGLVLVCQESGQATFRGFRKRHERPWTTPSGRVGWLAERTASDNPRLRSRGVARG